MREGSSRSGLFLIEMILVILFFSLVTALCVRLFVSAHGTGSESRNLTQAVMVSGNLAEAFYATGGDKQALQQLFEEASFGMLPHNVSEEGMLLFFDEDWQMLPADSSPDSRHFVAELSTDDTGDVRTARIVVAHLKDAPGIWGSPLYELEVMRYEPDEEDAP